MNSQTARDLATHEHVRFDNGDHVIVRGTPGEVQVTGTLNGEHVEYAGGSRDALEQATLLETGAPDAPWRLPADRAQRIASAIVGAAGSASADG